MSWRSVWHHLQQNRTMLAKWSAPPKNVIPGRYLGWILGWEPQGHQQQNYYHPTWQTSLGRINMRLAGPCRPSHDLKGLFLLETGCSLSMEQLVDILRITLMLCSYPCVVVQFGQLVTVHWISWLSTHLWTSSWCCDASSLVFWSTLFCYFPLQHF